jgi:pimeloyl-ACP methyl ester carboxylesterase
MAGRGESAWLTDPIGYNYASYVTDCLAVMDNFHLRSVEWVGTSMGGIIGMMIAATQPGRIRRLVLNDIGAQLDKVALTRIYEYVRTLPGAFATRADADVYLREIFAPWKIADTATWDAFVDSSLITRDGALRYACDPAIAMPLAAATENYTKIEDVNLTLFWNDIQIPTYILRGELSDILSVDTVRAMRASNLSTESITIPGVGHAPALMDQEQIAIVLNWLDRTPSTMMAASF